MCSLLTAGCGDGRPERVAVSGQVLIDGKPLDRGAVIFTPASGRRSTGALDSQGRFELFTFENGDGCTLGEHRVSIVCFEDVGPTLREWFAPKKYMSPDTSGLTQTIDGPTDDVQIDLTWGKQKGPFTERGLGE